MRKHGVSVFGQARVSAKGGGGGYTAFLVVLNICFPCLLHTCKHTIANTKKTHNYNF